VVVALTSEDLPRIHGDPMRLAQLFDNLVSNAIKFSLRGGGVQVLLHPDNGSVVLEVTDNGIGIPVSEQGHVFESFFRASNAAAQAIQGAGLGLSIVKMIVDAHGGSITFTSAEGEGTSFRIAFPRTPESAGQGRVGDQAA